MKNGKLKIIFFFSLMIFVIMFITLLVLSAATIFLIHFGILTGHGPKPLLIVFALMSLAVSTILSNVCIRKMVRPILEINEAAQKVARGDFEVKVSEQSIMAEVSAMAHNFNLMTQELAGMETFRSDFISNVSHEFKPRFPPSKAMPPCFRTKPSPRRNGNSMYPKFCTTAGVCPRSPETSFFFPAWKIRKSTAARNGSPWMSSFGRSFFCLKISGRKKIWTWISSWKVWIIMGTQIFWRRSGRT